MEDQSSDTLVLTTPKTVANPSLVQLTLEDYTRELLAKSKDYSDKIKTAKTKNKAAFYKKKLKKNNQELFRCMLGLHRITKAHQQEEPRPEPKETPWKIAEGQDTPPQYGLELEEELKKALTEDIVL